MTAAIIINPHAGAMRRTPELATRIAHAMGDRAAVHVTQDLAHLTELSQSLAQAGVTQVGILGGDGSASTVLTALFRAYGEQLPTITLLRGGTMNTVANSLGISRLGPLSLARRMARALSLAAGGQPLRTLKRPALAVGDRLGFLFGTGLFHGYMSEYYARGHGAPTPLTAATVLARSIVSALVGGGTYARITHAPALSVRFEGGAWPRHPYATIGAGTVSQVGLGFRPFARCMDDESHFHMVAIKGRPMEVAADLPSIWLGRGMRPQTAHETTACWAELASDGEPFGYSLDGDLAEAPGTLRLAIGPTVQVLHL